MFIYSTIRIWYKYNFSEVELKIVFDFAELNFFSVTGIVNHITKMLLDHNQVKTLKALTARYRFKDILIR